MILGWIIPNLLLSLQKFKVMKPIFVIQMPLGTPAEILEKAYDQVHSNGISEDYHVLLTIGSDSTATFKCFNSSYFIDIIAIFLLSFNDLLLLLSVNS